MGIMSFLDPGSIGKTILNPGGSMDWVMPYLDEIGTGVGSIIGAYYGGPYGAAAGGAIGGFGGRQLGSHLSKDPNYNRDPFSGEVLESSGKRAATGAAAGYAAGSLAGGTGWAPASATAGGSGLGYSGVGAYEAGGGGLTAGAPGVEAVGAGVGSGMSAGAGATTAKKAGIIGGMMDNKTLAGVMLAGAALDYAGNLKQAEATKAAQEQFRQDTSWTPERTSSYMNALNLIGQGAYGAEEEKKKKSVAELLAGSGRGGGAYGKEVESAGRERREMVAKLLAGGALETSKPPNYPLAAYSTTDPGGQAMINLGGTAGKYLTTAQQMAMLQALYGNQGATA